MIPSLSDVLTPQEANAALTQGVFGEAKIVFDAYGVRKVRLTLSSQGHCILLDAPPGTFDFLGLPAELRAMIYELIMLEPDFIALRTWLLPDKSKRIVQDTFTSSAKAGGTGLGLWDPITRKWTGRDTRILNLLLTSRAIYSEAVPILYGNNTFRFNGIGGFKTLKRMLSMSSSGTQDPASFLKRIEMGSLKDDMVNTQLPSTIKALQSCHNLRSVRFNHMPFCPALKDGLKTEWIVRKCWPLLKDMKLRMQSRADMLGYRGDKDTAKLLTVFSFPSDCSENCTHSPRCGCATHAEVLEASAKFTAEFKAFLKEHLDELQHNHKYDIK